MTNEQQNYYWIVITGNGSVEYVRLFTDFEKVKRVMQEYKDKPLKAPNEGGIVVPVVKVEYHDRIVAQHNKLTEILVKALEFYAKGNHFEWLGSDDFEPENPSGEPINYECGGAEGSEFTLENGGFASKALQQYRELSKEAGEL